MEVPIGRAMRRTAVIVVLAGASCVAVAMGASPFRLEVEGDYSCTTLVGANEETRENGTFKVSSQGCLWRVRVMPGSGGAQRGIQHFDVGHDGISIFEVIELGARPDQLASNARSSNMRGGSTNTSSSEINGSINKGIAFAYVDSIPAPAPNHAVNFWLAYASGCFFASNSPGVCRQLWEDRGSAPLPSTNLVSAAWELGEGQLLQSLVCYLPSTPKDASLQVSQPVFQYRVAERTNCGDLQIPIQFVVVRFREDDIASGSNAPRTLREFIAKTRTIHCMERSQAEADFVPALPSTTYVADLRLGSRDYLQRARYMVTNHGWPSIGALRIIQEQQDRKAHSLRSAQGLSSKKGVILMVLGALAVTGIVLVVKSYLAAVRKG